MTIILNGALADGADTVADLVERHLPLVRPTGVAVAVNATVVPRDRWAAWPLREGDVVDIVTAVQGG
ncbi:sulfur carrier protein ThiS [Nocardioides terrisoli]|uniref:sulfur carrier protein ThiS n=1 Tax=Nocardioides terrisoli TaxID=3388267 RepID=UPI00287B8665|nr:sulfur carrier protein ThiS [Nocardioides marmorisolisilvae]